MRRREAVENGAPGSCFATAVSSSQITYSMGHDDIRKTLLRKGVTSMGLCAGAASARKRHRQLAKHLDRDVQALLVDRGRYDSGVIQCFFDASHDATDTPYGSLCHPRSDVDCEVRDLIQQLFTENHEFVAPDLTENAKTQLQQCFWELFLADALRRRSIELVPRAKRKTEAGPDFLTVDGVWIEATAPGPGTGLDRVPEWECGGRTVPEREMQLRYLAGLEEKRRKFEEYKRKSIVAPDDPCVIALNAGEVGSSGELDVPRGVRAVFGVGWQLATLDTRTRTFTADSWEHEAGIAKASGAVIPKTGFLDATFCDIAAAVFSTATPWKMHGHGRFCDFVVAHNHNARRQIRLGSLPCFEEYAVEGDAMRRYPRSVP